MRTRAIQPAIFGIAALSFLLPFANVSCVVQDERVLTQTPVPTSESGEGRTVKGYEMLRGQPLPDEVREVSGDTDIDPDLIRIGAEPFAIVALGAALAGVVVAIFSPRARRGRDGVACGTAGFGAMVVLGLAPVLTSTGAYTVQWGYGYWVCLALFLAATWVSYETHRRLPRPRLPQRVSESPGAGAGSHLPPRPGRSPGPPEPPR